MLILSNIDMQKLFIDAGHSHSDPGAIATHNPLLREAELTVELRNAIQSRLKEVLPQISIYTDNDIHTLREVINGASQLLSPSDLLISLHFNAFSNSRASGVECFIRSKPSSATDLKRPHHLLAETFCASISKILSIPNRGVKVPANSARGSLGIFKMPTNVILLEVCFLSNPMDIATYRLHFNSIIEALVQHIVSYYSSQLSN